MDGVGSRIKEIRKDNKLTQAQFGEKIGLKDSAVSMLERNERSLTESVTKNIVAQFCVNQIWLKDGVGKKIDQDLIERVGVLQYMSNSSSMPLITKYLALFDKIQSLGAAEQQELLILLERLYSIFCISAPKEDVLDYINLLRLDFSRIIELFVPDIRGKSAVIKGENTSDILAADEEELLNIYRELDLKDRDEIMSFINFKNCTQNASKKKQKLLNCAHDEEAAAVQSKIG